MRSCTALGVVVLALVLVAPAEGAAPSGKAFRVGILSNVPLDSPVGAPVWGALLEGLRERGYVEGRNLTIVHRSTEGQYQRLSELAAELVRLKVDVIVAPATTNVAAARQATQTIPIVMAGSGDPVGAGLVASLARPGGNVTGLSMLSPEVTGKQLQLLKEIVPGLSRLAVLVNPSNRATVDFIGDLNGRAPALGLRLQILESRTPEDLDRALATATRERAGALFVMTDGAFLLHRVRLVGLAARHRLPAMYSAREFVDDGGLIVYAASMRDSFRRAATYVDKILNGARPADLPVEQPTTFELVINLKAANALGLAIPPSMLSRADEVLR